MAHNTYANRENKLLLTFERAVEGKASTAN